MPPRKRAAAKKTAAKPTTADAELSAIVEKSTPADADMEEMLTQYEQMASAYREPKEHKEKREELRKRITDRLDAEGPRYYLDANHNKRVAWSTTPETVDLDVEKVLAMDEEGSVPVDLIDIIAPRQIDRDGLRKAIATGKMTPEQVKEAVTIRPQTPRVYNKMLEGEGDE